MVGVDDGVADLKSHVASTPSAKDKVTTWAAGDKPSLTVNVQVTAEIRGFVIPVRCGPAS